MTMKRLLTSLAFLLICTGTLLTAADRNMADDGLRQYQWGAYEKALSTFETIFYGEPIDENVYASVALYMMIQCDSELKNYSRIIDNSRKFEQLFPQSRYLPDVLFHRAKALLERENPMAAMLNALSALSKTDDGNLEKSIMEFCDYTGRFYLSPQNMETLSYMLIDTKAITYLNLILADRYIAVGDFQSANNLLSNSKSNLTTLDYINKYKELTKYYQKSFTNQTKEINIAIVLPLSGKYSTHGEDLLEGIKFALENKRPKSTKRVNLVIVDTKSDVQTALIQLNNLLKMKDISAVIGPLTSDLATSMAPLCEFAGVPMISPTATSDRLTDYGDYVFQFNPSRQLRAKTIANYATDSLDYKRFGIISPTNEYGIATSTAFTQTVESNGGSIIYHLWYEGKPKSISDKLSRLKDEAEFFPPYFSFLDGFREAKANNYFDTLKVDSLLFTADSSDSLLSDSLILAFSDSSDSIVFALEDSLIADTIPQLSLDTNFVLDNRWADSFLYDSLLFYSDALSYYDFQPDSALYKFQQIVASSYAPLLTLEQRYNAIISDSLCFLKSEIDSSQLYVDLFCCLDFCELDSITSEFNLQDFIADSSQLTPYIDMVLVDSLVLELSKMDSLDALWLLSETDSTLFPYIFPVQNYGIDAVYMPVEQEDIRYLAPQWAKYRFDTHLLGDGNWYNKDLLKRYDSNIDSMIIASDYIWNSRDLELRKFSKSFNQKLGNYPNRIHIYGFETMDIVLDIIENGSLSAEEIKTSLANYNRKDGLIRKIEFRAENPQINSGVRLINYYKKQLRTIR